MVTIKNLERRMVVYNLVHDAHKRMRKFPVEVQPKKGPSIGRMQAKRTYDSLTFLARETKGVPDTVLECPDIVAGIRARRLQVMSKKSSGSPVTSRSPTKTIKQTKPVVTTGGFKKKASKTRSNR